MLQRFIKHLKPTIPAQSPPSTKALEMTFLASGTSSYADSTLDIRGAYILDRARHSSTDLRAWALIDIRTSLPPMVRTTDNPATAVKAGLNELWSSQWHAHLDFKSVTLSRMHSKTFSSWILAAKRRCLSGSSGSMYNLPLHYLAPVLSKNLERTT